MWPPLEWRCGLWRHLVSRESDCCRLDEQSHRLSSPRTAGAAAVPAVTYACRFLHERQRADLLATGDEDGAISLWDTATSCQRLVRYNDAHANAIYELDFNASARHMLSCAGDRHIRVWDVSTMSQLAQHTHKWRTFKTVAFLPDDCNVFASGGRDGVVEVWDNRVVGRVSHEIHPQTVKKGKATPDSTAQSSVTSLVFRDQNFLLSAGSANGSVYVWDLRRTYTGGGAKRAHRPYERFDWSPADHSVVAMTYDRCHGYLYVSRMHDILQRYNLMAWQADKGVCYGGHSVQSYFVRCAVSRCGQWLLSGSSDAEARLWHTRVPGSPVCSLPGHSQEVTCLDWSSRGDKLATFSDDNTFRTWRLRPSAANSALLNSDPAPLRPTETGSTDTAGTTADNTATSAATNSNGSNIVTGTLADNTGSGSSADDSDRSLGASGCHGDRQVLQTVTGSTAEAAAVAGYFSGLARRVARQLVPWLAVRQLHWHSPLSRLPPVTALCITAAGALVTSHSAHTRLTGGQPVSPPPPRHSSATVSSSQSPVGGRRGGGGAGGGSPGFMRSWLQRASPDGDRCTRPTRRCSPRKRASDHFSCGGGHPTAAAAALSPSATSGQVLAAGVGRVAEVTDCLPDGAASYQRVSAAAVSVPGGHGAVLGIQLLPGVQLPLSPYTECTASSASSATIGCPQGGSCSPRKRPRLCTPTPATATNGTNYSGSLSCVTPLRSQHLECSPRRSPRHFPRCGAGGGDAASIATYRRPRRSSPRKLFSCSDDHAARTGCVADSAAAAAAAEATDNSRAGCLSRDNSCRRSHVSDCRRSPRKRLNAPTGTIDRSTVTQSVCDTSVANCTQRNHSTGYTSPESCVGAATAAGASPASGGSDAGGEGDGAGDCCVMSPVAATVCLTTVHSPTAGLPNWVLDRVSPHSAQARTGGAASSRRRRSVDWLTRLARSKRPTQKDTHSEPAH